MAESMFLSYTNLMIMKKTYFDWDERKDSNNQEKHGVSFALAQNAFLDVDRVIAHDFKHSQVEARYYCFGKVGHKIMTVRFTYRENVIRIIGAGYWRAGVKIYEKENS